MVVRKTLPVQIFTGSKPERAKFKEVENYSDNRATGFQKPYGGMWTSTWETAFSEGWPYWVLGADLHTEQLNEAWLVTPMECRVIELVGFDMCHEFMVKYAEQLYKDLPSFHDPADYGGDSAFRRALSAFGNPSMACPVWTRVMEDADAVRLLTPYSMDVRLGPYLTFNGWDCESTIWLRWAFDDKETRKVDLTEAIEKYKREEESWA